MKTLLASLALALFFATGAAVAESGSNHSDDSGCHYQKWQDT